MIHTSCSIGGIAQHREADCETTDRGTTYIHPSAILRENVTVHRPLGANGETHIGPNAYLMTGVTVNHDTVVESDVTLCDGVKLAGHVTVQRGATIGMSACVHQGCVVGAWSMIGMLAPVTKHVLPFVLYNPKYTDIRKVNVKGLDRAGFSKEDIHQIYRFFETDAENPELLPAGPLRVAWDEWEDLVDEHKTREVYQINPQLLPLIRLSSRSRTRRD